MKLGIVLRTTGTTPCLDFDFVLEAERLGFDSAWTSEAWGGDAVTTVSWLLARTTKIKGGTGTLADFDIAPYVRVRMGDDVAACRDELRPELALYIGGMGARSKNFYNDLVRCMGYEEAATRIQDLFLGGKKQEAAAAVPDALIDQCSLVGPRASRAAYGVERPRAREQGR
jgi:hypothetical protein